MKIVVISDTHGDQETLGVLSGDVLIHCGDALLAGSNQQEQLDSLDQWFSKQNFKLVLCVGGNHDFLLEDYSSRGIPPFKHAMYLEDQAIEYKGVKFYGSPWIPELDQWAYYQNALDITQKWSAIPEDTDVLVTHTPPLGIFDRNSQKKNCGCPALRERLSDLQLRLHCFGHIHASAGIKELGNTRYVNASMVDRSYRVVRKPFVIDL